VSTRGKFQRCPICKQYHYELEKCDPLYEYQIPAYHGDDDWSKVHATDHAEAAEKACEEQDQGGDYYIISDGELSEILIRDEHGEVKRFSIVAEAEPKYYATEID